MGCFICAAALETVSLCGITKFYQILPFLLGVSFYLFGQKNKLASPTSVCFLSSIPVSLYHHYFPTSVLSIISRKVTIVWLI